MVHAGGETLRNDIEYGRGLAGPVAEVIREASVKPASRRKRCRQAVSQQITEQCIHSLQLLHFELIEQREYAGMRQDYCGENERYLVKNHPYQTPYGTVGRGEWLIVSHELTASLECKHQEGSGSVDEKLPYVVARCHNSAHRGLILVLGGRYWTDYPRGKAAVEWCRREAAAMDHLHRKRLVVCSTFDEFIKFAQGTWR